MRRAAWFALAGALCLAAPASAQRTTMEADDDMVCYTDETAKQCAEKHYTDLQRLIGNTLDPWRKRFERASWKQDDNCQAVRSALFEAFDMTESAVDGVTEWIYLGKPKESGNIGAHWDAAKDSTEHLFVVSSELDDAGRWRTFQHEAAHHAGYSKNHTEDWNAYDAAYCATEEEEDPGGGGNEEDDPDDPGETCTTSTDWVPVQRDCSYWSGGSLPNLIVCTEIVYIPVEVVTCS